MPRQRPDPEAARARLAAVAPVPHGGWLPPPDVEPAPAWSPLAPEPELVDDVVRSWSPRPFVDDAQPTGPPVLGALAGLVPVGLRGGRWDPGRQGTAALAVVALLAAGLAGLLLLRARPHEVAPPVARVDSAPPVAAGVVVVDVAGRVRHPGIVRLPLGSRVDDAVRAAGGPLPGATFDGLNRAQKLTDGEQVVVGAPAPAAAGPAGPAGGLVDINTADVATLDGLPGIGPVLAQKIVDWRTAHGQFASIDQLREVGGIGESKFAALKNKVRT